MHSAWCVTELQTGDNVGTGIQSISERPRINENSSLER